MIDLITNQEINNTMKKILLILFLWVSIFETQAQEVSLPPKFFTLRNARISGGFGFETGWASNNKGLLYRYRGSPMELNSVIDSATYGTWNLGFDLYAPNSFMGFLIEADYGSWDLNIHKDQSTESFVVRTLEIPFYLKLRPGSIEKSGHVWLVLGASYIIPIGIDRVSISGITDHDKSQLNGVKVLTGMLGYEYFFGELAENKVNNPKGACDRMRIVLFTRFSYLLDSRLNSEYYQSPNKSSILSDYQGFDYKDYVVTFGIKYFFRLGKFDQGSK